VSHAWKIAVLGDSVPWGQGLLDKHKYVTQIAAKLCRSPQDDLCMLAHSGALIGAEYRGDGAPANHEVPVPGPVILQQVDLVPNPGEVDLVLLNGGLNDVDLRTVLNPLTKTERLRELTSNVCYRDMKTLLLKACSVFRKPGRQILVTGYYPILSDESDLDVFDEVDAFEHLIGIFGHRLRFYHHRENRLARVRSHALQFWRESNAAIAKAVSEVQSLVNAGDRLRYVPCPLSESHALFTGDARLFAFGPELHPEDEVAAERKVACELHFKGLFQGVQRSNCRHASVGHPNVKGSNEIAASILNAL